MSEKKLQEPLVQDASPLGTEEPAPTADKEELPVIVFLFYVLIRRYCPYFQTEESSTEDIASCIKRLSTDDSYLCDSSKTTSTASSLSGEVVLGGGNKPLRLLNTFLEECDVKTIIKPQIEWNDCVNRIKRRYIQHTRDIIVAVLKVVSPENVGYLWTALQASKAVNDELGVEGILLPAQRVYLEAIAETYKNASS